MFPDTNARHERTQRIAYDKFLQRLRLVPELESRTALDDWLYAERSLGGAEYSQAYKEGVAFFYYNSRLSSIRDLRQHGALDDWLWAERRFEQENFIFVTVEEYFSGRVSDDEADELAEEVGRFVEQADGSPPRIDPRDWGVKALRYADPEGLCGLTSADDVVISLSTALSLTAAAGGIKWLVDILKVWVEDRKERSITIKKGDVEIVLKGGVGDEQIERAVKLFKENFEESKIIKP